MKKSLQAMLGVTLLEIMLVLAVASMVIVLSIKYYQSASASSQANSIMQALQSITAAAENISQGSGSYSGITQSNIEAVVSSSVLKSPWGDSLTFTGNTTYFEVDVDSPPDAVCALIMPKFAASSHTATSTCSNSGSLKYYYYANPSTSSK